MTQTLECYIHELDRAGLLVSEQVTQQPHLCSTRIDCLTYDSRSVGTNALFVVKGAHFRPQFLTEAINRGAIAYVIDEAQAVTLAATFAADSSFPEATSAIPAITVTDIRKALPLLGGLFFDHVTDKLTTIGITGTKGKSTTVYYLRSIMQRWLAAEQKRGPAILSSIKNYDGGEEEESHLTTPEVLDLYAHFSRAHQAGISHMAMEVSSQALKYGRVQGMRFAVAAFTNIGADHISPSEHPTFEDYYQSKLKIFDVADISVISTDADCADETLAAARISGTHILTYGSHESDNFYCDPASIVKRDGAIWFTVRSTAPTNSLSPMKIAYNGTFSITMPGLFNVNNALCAIAICSALGIPSQYVREGLREARVPGRMETLTSDDGQVTVIVDYAHNKLSYEAVFESAKKEYPGYALLSIFGSAGGKAFDRRKDLGEAVSAYCDHVWITEEDNYHEPFASIATDIAKHVRVPYIIEEDRSACINDAINNWSGKHVVCILGKGAETTRARADEYVEVPTDAHYAQKALEQYNATTAQHSNISKKIP